MFFYHSKKAKKYMTLIYGRILDILNKLILISLPK